MFTYSNRCKCIFSRRKNRTFAKTVDFANVTGPYKVDVDDAVASMSCVKFVLMSSFVHR